MCHGDVNQGPSTFKALDCPLSTKTVHFHLDPNRGKQFLHSMTHSDHICMSDLMTYRHNPFFELFRLFGYENQKMKITELQHTRFGYEIG